MQYIVLILIISAAEGAVVLGILFGILFASRIHLFYGSRSPDEILERFYLLPKPFRINFTQVVVALAAAGIIYASWSKNQQFKQLIDKLATAHQMSLPLEIWSNGAGWFVGLLLAVPLGRLGIRPLFKKCQNLPFWCVPFSNK